LEARDSTIVAPQALALMNNPLAHELSESFGRRIEKEAGGNRASQVQRAWTLAFGRQPTARELSRSLTFLASESRANPPAKTRFESVREPVPDGLALWLRADAGVTGDVGGTVAGWADQSGRKHDAAQIVVSAQPALAANAINGKPALRFDGKARFLAIK